MSVCAMFVVGCGYARGIVKWSVCGGGWWEYRGSEKGGGGGGGSREGEKGQRQSWSVELLPWLSRSIGMGVSALPNSLQPTLLFPSPPFFSLHLSLLPCSSLFVQFTHALHFSSILLPSPFSALLPFHWPDPFSSLVWSSLI